MPEIGQRNLHIKDEMTALIVGDFEKELVQGLPLERAVGRGSRSASRLEEMSGDR